MTDDPRESWERFLNPETLRQNLIVGSMYLAGFEILRDSIIDGIRDFYVSGFDQDGFIVSPEYQATVLKRCKSPLAASTSWLHEHDVIDAADLLVLDDIRRTRNEIAHNMPQLIFSGVDDKMASRFGEMVRLVDKIEKWWIINVDVATDPDHAAAGLDEESIVPEATLMLHLMTRIALGEHEDASEFYDEFRKLADGVQQRHRADGAR